MTPTREDKMKEILVKWFNEEWGDGDAFTTDDVVGFREPFDCTPDELLRLASLAYDAALEDAAYLMDQYHHQAINEDEISEAQAYSFAGDHLRALKEVKP